ncbi:MAG: hypothetical protein ROO73_01235 [Roseivirga sp.]
MKKILLPLLALLPGASLAREPQDCPESLPVLISKVSTLVFPEEIIDVETPSPHYHLKVKGRYLLLRAKSSQAPSSSIFVRFGKEKTAFVAEIFPHNEAPLQHFVGGESALHLLEEPLIEANDAFPIYAAYLPQQYFDCGVKEMGLQIILTNILHSSKATFLRLFTYNNTAIDLLFDSPTFELVSFLQSSFFRSTRKAQQVEPLLAPALLSIPHQQGVYLAFVLPLYAPNGGLSITFSEKEGERRLQLFIPAHLLLQAR